MTVSEVEKRINLLNKSYSIQEHIKATEEEITMMTGMPEQTRDNIATESTKTDRIVLKGQGKYKEVLDKITEIIGPNPAFQHGATAILDYLEAYLKGRLTREEFIYTVNSWFIGDNLKATGLMDVINDHADEWRELMKNPQVWFDQYWKVTNKVTGKSHIEPGYPGDKPYNIINTSTAPMSPMNPHSVSPGGFGIAPAPAGLQAVPANTSKLVDGSNLVNVDNSANVDVDNNASYIGKAVDGSDPRDFDKTEEDDDGCLEAGCDKPVPVDMSEDSGSSSPEYKG